jgi:hypothetical protein
VEAEQHDINRQARFSCPKISSHRLSYAPALPRCLDPQSA